MNAGASTRKRLYLIRHGAAEDTAGRCIGHTDVPLGVTGIEQCARLAMAWRPPHDSVLWASDLSRAVRTAQRLAAHWTMNPASIHLHSALRECSFGEWDGRTWADIEATDRARLDAWMQEWHTLQPPGGESLPAFAARVHVVLDRMASSDATSHVVVAHAGVLRAILCRVTGAPDTAAFNFAVPHAHVTAVTLDAAPRAGCARGSLEWLNAYPPPA